MPLRCDHGPDLNPTQHCYPIHSFIPRAGLAFVLRKPIICSRHRGQPAACEGVFVCACPSIIISGCNSIVITIYFILSQISHPFRSSVWLGVRSEVLGGQGSYSLFFSQSPPSSLRRFGCSFELDSCQELSWQLSWTEKKERKYPPDPA